jgi:hypothetical protein
LKRVICRLQLTVWISWSLLKRAAPEIMRHPGLPRSEELFWDPHLWFNPAKAYLSLALICRGKKKVLTGSNYKGRPPELLRRKQSLSLRAHATAAKFSWFCPRWRIQGNRPGGIQAEDTTLPEPSGGEVKEMFPGNCGHNSGALPIYPSSDRSPSNKSTHTRNSMRFMALVPSIGFCFYLAY